jgi:hypothetical protein
MSKMLYFGFEEWVAFHATRLTGGHTCPTHPPTPSTVTLDEPLGERRVLDGGFWPFQTPSPRPTH